CVNLHAGRHELSADFRNPVTEPSRCRRKWFDLDRAAGWRFVGRSLETTGPLGCDVALGFLGVLIYLRPPGSDAADARSMTMPNSRDRSRSSRTGYSRDTMIPAAPGGVSPEDALGPL